MLLHRDNVRSPWSQIELSNTSMSAEMTIEERFSINFKPMKSPQKGLQTRIPKIKGQWTEKAWVPFEPGMRNGNNLATEHPFSAQKNVNSCWKTQKWKTSIFPFCQVFN